MIYLASPYAHKSFDVMVQRYEAVCFHAGIMMQRGHVVYSPIAHNHPIAQRVDLPKGWDYWKHHDLNMLRHCEELWVLQLEGWNESRGCLAEMDFARELGMPVVFQDPNQWL